MPRRHFLLAGSCLLIALVSGCVTTLPIEIVPTSVPPVSAATAPPSTEPVSNDVLAVAGDTTPPAATAVPGILLSPTPVPTPPPAWARDQALTYLQEGYQMNLPAPELFSEIDSAQVAMTGMQSLIAYGSGNWRVVLGTSELTPPGTLDVVLDNAVTEARWWGQVDAGGAVVTLVAVELPRPDSKAVVGWKGKVVSLPPESPYDDYFEGAKGNRHGILSNDADIQTVLGRLAHYDGRVQVWGELRYAAPDYNGRQILVDRIELLDGPLSAADTASADIATAGTPAAEDGPIGALTMPEFGSILVDHVLVSGEAEGVFENHVVVQVESDEGEVYGQASAITDAPDIGQKGAFTVDIPFHDPPETGNGRVALYSESAGDGSLTLLAWLNVRFAGAASGMIASILTPEAGTRLKGSVQITGTAVGVHDQRVLVRVEDLTGLVWGQARVKTDVPGNWHLKLSVRRPPTARPGRIAVYDVDPASGQKVLLAQRDVFLRR